MFSFRFIVAVLAIFVLAAILTCLEKFDGTTLAFFLGTSVGSLLTILGKVFSPAEGQDLLLRIYREIAYGGGQLSHPSRRGSSHGPCRQDYGIGSAGGRRRIYRIMIGDGSCLPAGQVVDGVKSSKSGVETVKTRVGPSKCGSDRQKNDDGQWGAV
jgi:uncharacterized membrane protein